MENAIFEELEKKKLVDRIIYKLDTAEAVYMGNVGTASKKGFNGYKEWRNNLQDVLHLAVYGEKKKTLIDLYKDKQKERIEKNKKWLDVLKKGLKKGGIKEEPKT